MAAPQPSNSNRLASRLAYWVLPEGVRNALRNHRRNTAPARPAAPGNPRDAEAIQRAGANLELRGRHAQQRCFILATGPSLGRQNLEPLRNELCIGVSFFFLHPQAKVVRPKYHVVAPNHPPFDFTLPKRYFSGLTENYDPSTEVLYGYATYPYSCLDCLDSHPQAWNRPLRIVNYTGAKELTETSVESESAWDLTGRPFLVRTVIYSAIQLAVYLGCNQIYLLGCDHDYLADVKRTENHFYQESKGNPDDRHHLEAFTTERWFQEYHRRWRDYRLMRTALEKRGIQIINATDGGMLDVFPRVSLASLFPA
ncbi:MAG: hypothetical protein JNK85_09520 [Verrucomicrobiales bacterium]|nr:hypothetical protein [Verrucomicrobiales bacterium]